MFYKIAARTPLRLMTFLHLINAPPRYRSPCHHLNGLWKSTRTGRNLLAVPLNLSHRSKVNSVLYNLSPPLVYFHDVPE